jgi:hypothetical protein
MRVCLGTEEIDVETTGSRFQVFTLDGVVTTNGRYHECQTDENELILEMERRDFNDEGTRGG